MSIWSKSKLEQLVYATVSEVDSWLHRELKENYTCQNQGLFTLHGTGTSASVGNRTGTIGNNGSWSLSLSQINANISTWYFSFGPGPLLCECTITNRKVDQHHSVLPSLDTQALRQGFRSLHYWRHLTCEEHIYISTTHPFSAVIDRGNNHWHCNLFTKP